MKNRHRYPKIWRKLARACKEQAGWRCQHCGIEHGALRISVHTGNEYRVWMQAAHINHDPDNPDPKLICVCATCHWHHYRAPGRWPAWFIEKLKHKKLIDQAYCL